MNKRILTLATWACACTLCMAQSTAPDVLSTAGGNGASSTAQLSWTIGEPVATTVAAGAHTLTQGFQQPWAEIITLAPERAKDDDGITVYHNPARHVLHVVVPEAATSDRYHLTDQRGQLLLQGRMKGTTTDLDLGTYASGNYYLRLITPEGKTERTFKIIIAQ